MQRLETIMKCIFKGQFFNCMEINKLMLLGTCELKQVATEMSLLGHRNFNDHLRLIIFS